MSDVINGAPAERGDTNFVASTGEYRNPLYEGQFDDETPEQAAHRLHWSRTAMEVQSARLNPAPATAEQHPDDAAVDRFAVAMKSKLAKSREKGRHGWQNATAAHLASLLYEHMYKGDPLDVANLAMMLHQNGQGIELPHDARREPAPADSDVREVK